VETINESEHLSPETASSTPFVTPSVIKKRRFDRTEFRKTPTEKLLEEQVKICKEQVEVFKSIRDLMEERNEIERAKLAIMQRQTPLMISNSIVDESDT